MEKKSFDESLSIVVTAYNEEAVLENFVDELVDFVSQNLSQYEVIVVNDGSTDQTAKIMQSIQQRYPNSVKLEHLTVNSGMGAAIQKGFSKAKYDWLTFFPADGQIKPVELYKIFERISMGNVDCVTTVYNNRKYGLKRKIISSVFHNLTKLILGRDPKNQGIYMLRNSVYNQLKLYSSTFLFNLELPVKVQNLGFALASVKIKLSPRIAGESKAMQKPRILMTLWQMFLIRLRS